MALTHMRRTLSAIFAGCAVLIGTASAQPAPLRICGDPDNLPFSN